MNRPVWYYLLMKWGRGSLLGNQMNKQKKGLRFEITISVSNFHLIGPHEIKLV